MGNLTSLVELMQNLLTRLAKARLALYLSRECLVTAGDLITSKMSVIISPILREESSPDSIISFRNLMEELEPEVKAISKKSCLAVSLSSSSNLRPLSSSNTLFNSSSSNRKRDLERVRTWADTCFFSNSSTSLRSLTIWEIFSTIFCFRVEGDNFFRKDSLGLGLADLCLIRDSSGVSPVYLKKLEGYSEKRDSEVLGEEISGREE